LKYILFLVLFIFTFNAQLVLAKENNFKDEVTYFNLSYFENNINSINLITKDDDYTNTFIYLNTSFEIGLDNNILKNDNITNLDIYDIVLVSDSLSCGSLDDVTINKDGTFKYISNYNCLGNVSFDYYILYNLDGNIVSSNSSTVTLNVIKKPTVYTVKYLDYETKMPLADEKVVTSNYLYDEVSEVALDIYNYNLIGDNIFFKTLNKDNEEIIFYYVYFDKIFYVVNYYYNDKINLGKREVFLDVNVGDLINSFTDKLEYGYTFNYANNLPLVISDKNDNIINIFYEKKISSVLIKYVDTSGNKLLDDNIISDFVGNYYKTEKIDIDGYELVDILGNEKGIIEEDNNEITYLYEFVVPKTGVCERSFHFDFLIIFYFILFIFLKK